ncbi:MFS transporter [Paenarthrobacter sp. NPDC090520]|uniref:MFS transporter n=1 Tax=unclassified Paenarthrobacter TaxID=2634190 RepID=UPI00381401ED
MSLSSVGSEQKVERPPKRVTAGLGGGVALEWYDWNIYGLMAAFLGPHFFPSDNPVTSTLSALAVFGVGFIARPLGAVLLGPLADRFSHRKVMILSVTTMCVTSFLMGILPTAETIGIAAGFILVGLRLIQGLSTGVEAGVANAVAIQLAPRGERGRYLGLVAGTFIQFGIVGSAVISYVASLAIPADALASWGWRIPFILGGIFGVVVILLRRTLPETLTQKAEDETSELDIVTDRIGLVWASVWKVRLALLAVIFVIAGVTVATYSWNVGLPNLANTVYKEDPALVFLILVGMGVLFIIAGPVVGRMADVYGAGRVFTVLRVLLVPASFVMLLYSQPGIWSYAMVMFVGGTVVASNMGLYNYIATSLMPKSARTTGVSLGTGIAAAVFGGTASYLLLFFRVNDLYWVFPVYISVLSALSVVFYWLAVRRGHQYVQG